MYRVAALVAVGAGFEALAFDAAPTFALVLAIAKDSNDAGGNNTCCEDVWW
jgi:hypothetical protein